MRKFTYRISVADFRDAYLDARADNDGHGEVFFCWVLERCVRGYAPVSSRQVIQQFVKAKPERFMKDYNNGVIITHLMKSKYRDVRDPRLALLNSLPDKHILEFEMHEFFRY